MIPKHQKEGFLVFLKDKRKKPYPKILLEFLTLWKEKKELPLYYFKFLYRKDVTNIKDYLSTKQASRIQHSENLHRKEYLDIISNKLVFSLFCSRNSLPVPELISYNFRNSFFWNNECYEVSNEEDLYSFFKKVFEKTKKERLFLKRFSLYGGKGACIVRKSFLMEDVKKNAKEIINNDHIHEEVLVQHVEIDRIHPNCLNTLRVETYIDKHNKTHILSAYMRFGTGNSVVDNATSGGIYVGIDMLNGTLKDTALQEVHFGGNDFEEHPDSNFIFKGFKVPFFKEVCELVLKATDFLPDRFIGWDIAVTNDGPIIIEANEYPDLSVSGTAYGGYLKNPLFNEILEEA